MYAQLVLVWQPIQEKMYNIKMKISHHEIMGFLHILDVFTIFIRDYRLDPVVWPDTQIKILIFYEQFALKCDIIFPLEII